MPGANELKKQLWCEKILQDCVRSGYNGDNSPLSRVPTRSLFPGKVLTFDNGSLGPGKVLSFSSFPKRSWRSPYFLIKCRVAGWWINAWCQIFYKFSKQPVSKFMLCKFSSQNLKMVYQVQCGFRRAKKQKVPTYMVCFFIYICIVKFTMKVLITWDLVLGRSLKSP